MKCTSGGNCSFWIRMARPTSPGNSALKWAATESSANATAASAHNPATSAVSRRVHDCETDVSVVAFGETSSEGCSIDDRIRVLFLTLLRMSLRPLVRYSGYSAERRYPHALDAADRAGRDVFRHAAHTRLHRRLADRAAI